MLRQLIRRTALQKRLPDASQQARGGTLWGVYLFNWKLRSQTASSRFDGKNLICAWQTGPKTAKSARQSTASASRKVKRDCGQAVRLLHVWPTKRLRASKVFMGWPVKDFRKYSILHANIVNTVWPRYIRAWCWDKAGPVRVNLWGNKPNWTRQHETWRRGKVRRQGRCLCCHTPKPSGAKGESSPSATRKGLPQPMHRLTEKVVGGTLRLTSSHHQQHNHCESIHGCNLCCSTDTLYSHTWISSK